MHEMRSPQGQSRGLSSLVPRWRGGPCVRLWKVRRDNKPIPAQKPTIGRKGEYVSSEIENRLQERGVNIADVIASMQQFRVETPSWGYGNSGTRFKVFPWPGAARNLREKLEDAAIVQKVTGKCPSVAIHIPWDRVDNWQEAKDHAAHLGLRLGAVNPNLFQDNEYRFGSLCHPDATIRRRAIEHMLECVDIARVTGSDTISLWLADGTNYPGQDDMRAPPSSDRGLERGLCCSWQRPAPADRVQIL